MDVGGWEIGTCDVSRLKIVKKFHSLLKIFNIMKLFIQSIQNPAFS